MRTCYDLWMSAVEKICASIIVAGVILAIPVFLFTDPLGILFGLYIIFAVPIILIAGLSWFFVQRKKMAVRSESVSKPSYSLRIVKSISVIGAIVLVLIFGALIILVVRGF